MLIDWFTVAAQIVNFLILIWLLKRFLYGPILRAMDKREDRIRDRLREAEQKRSEAEEEAEAYRRKKREIEDREEELIGAAKEEAEQRRKDLLERAREQAEEARENWEQAVRRERRAFLEELRKRTGAEVIKVSRKALADLADEELEVRLAEMFARRLKELDEDQRRSWKRASEEGGVTVRTSFELDGTTKGRITKAIHGVCGKDAEVGYRVDGDRGFGIQLTAGDLRMNWGSEGYLDGLERELGALLEEVEGEEGTGAGDQ